MIASSAGVVGGAAAGAYFAHSAYDMWRTRRDRKVPTIFLRDDDGALLHLTVWDTWGATLVPVPKTGEWSLTVQHTEPRRAKGARSLTEPLRTITSVLNGAAAQRALAAVLPHVNPTGGSRRQVRDAMDVIGASANLAHLIEASVRVAHPERAHVTRLPARFRVALEMVVHSDDERRAMEGEHAELERRWREAEEIASIADSLLPDADGIEARLDALRRRNPDASPHDSAAGSFQ